MTAMRLAVSRLGEAPVCFDGVLAKELPMKLVDVFSIFGSQNGYLLTQSLGVLAILAVKLRHIVRSPKTSESENYNNSDDFWCPNSLGHMSPKTFLKGEECWDWLPVLIFKWPWHCLLITPFVNLWMLEMRDKHIPKPKHPTDSNKVDLYFWFWDVHGSFTCCRPSNMSLSYVILSSM